MSNQEIVAVVKELLQAIEKTKDGFGVAAEATGSVDMKLLFIHYFHQCEQFLIELHNVAIAFGDSIEETADVPSIERSHPSDPVTARDFIAILSECEREEDHVMNEYRKAITLPLPPDVLHTVEAQGLEIKAAHDKLKYLSHLAHAA